MTRRVLFVCTGNTCRSPMAAALLRAAVGAASQTEAIEIDSAGTSASAGDSATELAIQAMRRRGIDLSGHRAVSLSRNAVEKAVIVLTMTERHKDSVLRRVPAAAEKVFTICEYASAVGEVEDPLPHGTEEAYEHCAEQLSRLMRSFATRLRGG